VILSESLRLLQFFLLCSASVSSVLLRFLRAMTKVSNPLEAMQMFYITSQLRARHIRFEQHNNRIMLW